MFNFAGLRLKGSTKVAAWKMELLKMYFLFKMRDFNGFYQPAMFGLLEGSS